MSPELKNSIDNLYDSFSSYPFNTTMTGCECCFNEEEHSKLHKETLQKIEADIISKFTLKAFTTWGDTTSFKHFLPRILELLATKEMLMNTFIVFEKLELGEWRTWPDSEQQAIIDFTYAWWSDLIKNGAFFQKEEFVEINKLINNIDKMLELWTISFDDNSFSNYVDLIYSNYYDLFDNSKIFKEISQETKIKVVRWINLNAKILEEGFFRFEKTDKDFAEKISNALLFIENKYL